MVYGNFGTRPGIVNVASAGEEGIVEITKALAADLEDVLLVERLAFGSDEEPRLVQALLEDPSARPVLSLLARDHGKPVGHILFTAARLEPSPREVSIAILAPLAVVPDAQRQGIGTHLIAEGALLLAKSGVELLFVLGHPEYYPRHGFESATRLGLSAPYPVSPEEAWMVRALRPGVLGVLHGTVICADAMNRPEYWRE